jgi:hypothetical protein
MSTSASRHEDSERRSSTSLDTPWLTRSCVRSKDFFWLSRVSFASCSSSRSAISVSQELATSETSSNCAAVRFSSMAK